MTNEELMIPRFRVIADYPNSVFPVGAIITLDDEQTPKIKHETIKGSRIILNNIGDFNKYPHLFEKIKWFWNRSKFDMPEYVKFMWHDKIDDARKVKKWLHIDEPKETGEIIGFTYESAVDKDIFPRVSMNGWTPATEEEFNYFMNEVLIKKK